MFRLRVEIKYITLAAVAALLLLGAQQAWPVSDLRVIKSVDNEAPDAPGQTVEFTVEVRNTGDATVEKVVLRDRLPAELALPEVMVPVASTGRYNRSTGIWRIPSIVAGSSEFLTIPVIVNASPQPACIVNRATLLDAVGPESNYSAIAAIRRPDIERCVELSPRWFREPFSGSCGSKQRVEYEFWVWNRGAHAARDVTLNVSETSSFKLPGFRLTSSNCTANQCTWDSVPADEIVVARAQSSEFRNGERREHSLRLVVRTRDEDYEPDNDSYATTRVIQPFEACPDFGIPEPTLPLGGGGSGSGCFIATAAYGSPMDARIEVLRRFRDQWLMPHEPGRHLVATYYRFSPPVADFIASRPPLRLLVRVLLAPLIGFLSYPLLSLLAIAGSISVAVWCRLKRQRS